MKLLFCITVAASMYAMGWAEDAPVRRERAQLTDEQRAQMEQRLNAAWSQLSLREKQQVLRLNKALQQMPAEERQFVHERIVRYMNMSPEERQKLHENAERWKNMTPDQREQVRQKFQQRRREYEAKWRKEHPGEELPPFPFRKHQSPPATESDSTTNQTRSTQQRNKE